MFLVVVVEVEEEEDTSTLLFRKSALLTFTFLLEHFIHGKLPACVLSNVSFLPRPSEITSCDQIKHSDLQSKAVTSWHP